eukprot:1006855-Rhodomonas_salina.1
MPAAGPVPLPVDRHMLCGAGLPLIRAVLSPLRLDGVGLHIMHSLRLAVMSQQLAGQCVLV